MHRFALALIPAVLAAQTVMPPATDQPPGSVEGRVTNTLTGDIVSGAILRLDPTGRRPAGGWQPQTATSQADGNFRFEAVAPGIYSLSAQKDGFVPLVLGASTPPVTVGPEQQITNLAVQLNPQGSVSGKIVDEQGQPVPRIFVELFTGYTLRGKLQLRRASTATSNNNGEFNLKNVMPGKYYLAAEPQSPTRGRQAPEESVKKPQSTAEPDSADLDLVRTFYPQSLDFENATPIEIHAGQDLADANIRIQRAQTFHIRGKIAGVSADGTDPSGMNHGWSLILGPRNSLASDALGRIARANSDGTFDIDKVVAGSYTLSLIGVSAMAPLQVGRNHFRAGLLARQDLDVGASDVNGVILSVIPPINLTGRVRLEGADNTDLSGVRVNVTPAGDAAVGGFQSAVVKSDGTFAINNLDPGQYVVRVAGGPPGSYSSSIAFNRQDITTTGMDVTQGGSGEIDIVLRTGAAEVDGTIQASETTPQGNAIVALIPAALPPDGSGILFASAPPGGGFAIRNVPPGQYYAFALGRWSAVWQNAEFLRELQRDGTSVDVPENGHLQIQLSTIGTDRIQAVAAQLGLSAQ